MLRLSAIGDTCHALAVARAMQDYWPETRLTWIIGKTEATLLGDVPGIEFITFDKGAGLAEYARLRHKLASRRFDALLCMHASLRANLLIPMIRAERKLGFDLSRARDHQRWFVSERVPPLADAHVLDGMMQFAEALGVLRGALRWDIPIADEERAYARSLCPSGQPVLLISPCSSQRLRNFRNWAADRYALVARHAQQAHGCAVIITGGSSDEERRYGALLADAIPDAVNLVGGTTLKQLYGLITMAAVVLCPDSGPAHMATAAGTRVVGLYATSDPRRTGPYLSQRYVVNAYPQATRRYLGKSPDELRFGTRVRHPDAMNLIDPELVKASIDRAILD